MLKRNLIANYLGQGWTAVMGLLFVPFYIKYLGIEAYGLIGLFAILTACLTLLDVGLTPMLGREMARFTGGSHTAHSIRDLLRTVEIILIFSALLLTGGLIFGSNWIAMSWLKAESLPVEVIAPAVAIMGLVAALRLIETVYRSSILGLQFQVLFNIANSIMATLRGLGAVAVLVWVSPTIQAFFIWQGAVSILTLVVFAAITYAALPPIKRAASFSIAALREVWRFAGGVVAITFLALLLTQVDKILLSKLLSLKEYGYYALAAAVAGSLHALISPTTQAFYPRICELHTRNDAPALIGAFHKAAQLVSVLAGSAAIVIVLFSETFLRLWTQDFDLAARSAPLLSLLMAGNLLNGLMWVPYQTQLAYGWTSLTIRINLIAVVIVIPAIIWVTPRYGTEGAAWFWLILNAANLLVGVHFMYKKILIGEKLSWYTQDLLAPLGAGFAASLIVKVCSSAAGSTFSDFFLLFFATVCTASAALVASNKLRPPLFGLLLPRLLQLGIDKKA